MPTDQAMDTVAEHVRSTTAACLRQEFPWMKTEALNDLAEKLAAECRVGIVNQLPEMRASQERVNFFSLPRELRDIIYDFALIRNSSSEPRYGPTPRTMIEISSFGESLKLPALLCVSRQTRREASEVYYSGNTFVTIQSLDAEKEDESSNSLKKWLNAIGPRQASLIKTLHLEFGNWTGITPADVLEKIVDPMKAKYASQGLLPPSKRAMIMEAYGFHGLGVKEEAWKFRFKELKYSPYGYVSPGYGTPLGRGGDLIEMAEEEEL